MMIRTVAANCQDCNRCVRFCPIGAIRVEGGQARVDGRLCVQCGICVRECPQHAKTIVSSLEAVQEMIEQGHDVVASVSSAFAGAFPGWRATRLPAALRLLGFSTVSEVAEGSALVARETAARRDDASITSCCPAVVSYVEKYRPALLPLLMPVASPMVAHGRLLKARRGKAAKVVHIGPCGARKEEAARKENHDAVDAVLTFDEILHWMEIEGVSLSTCPESDFETYGELGAARLLPIEGGLLRAAGIADNAGMADVLRVSGAKDVLALLDTPPQAWPYDVVEVSFCHGGCVGSPCMPAGCDVLDARRSVIDRAHKAFSYPGDLPVIPMEAAFRPMPVDRFLPEIDEARIEQVLDATGKADPASRLDCGACGYDTCRENAIAVARGMAEPGMCMSYVRKKAERRADSIIKGSPNGIIVVDRDLTIVQVNARFQKMFGTTGNLLGRPLSSVVDPGGFEKLLGGAQGLQEAIGSRDGMRYQELIFFLPGDTELTGIYVDISSSALDAHQVDMIKDQSLKHARDLLAHQIRFSQEMAHYLGKSTAQTEELVRRMMDMYAEGGEA